MSINATTAQGDIVRVFDSDIFTLLKADKRELLHIDDLIEAILGTSNAEVKWNWLVVAVSFLLPNGSTATRLSKIHVDSRRLADNNSVRDTLCPVIGTELHLSKPGTNAFDF